MKNKLRIVLAQLNFTVGDLAGNKQKQLDAVIYARDHLKADIIVFSELSLCGYPAEDLLLRKHFMDACNQTLNELINQIEGIYCVVGYPQLLNHKRYNSACIFYNKKIIGHYQKRILPNYGVFDEQRYFENGNQPFIFNIGKLKLGIMICEDLWRIDPIKETVKQNAQIIFSLNASPFESNKFEKRKKMLTERTQSNHVPICYVNSISGQDELVFDGGSMVVSQQGEIVKLAPFFEENLLAADFDLSTLSFDTENETFNIPERLERIYNTLKLGLKDYVEKNHFPGVLIGLSGGIDSALSLCIACDALGPDHVIGVLMPSEFTAQMSIDDAKTLAQNLGVKTHTIPINQSFDCLLETLSPLFHHTKKDVTEENIQSRIRAIILMALSNKWGQLVVSTGNRSELAVGYCTLYGDMVGGYAVIRDVYKTMVYELANYRNKIKPDIPIRTISRPPTAELSFNQKDEDSLPPYTILDAILIEYLDHKKSAEEMISLGYNAEIVKKVIHLITKSEYKRRQAAIGPRINIHSFGRDWRYPLTNGFKS